MRTVGSPITMSRSRTGLRHRPPTLGEDRDQVLGDLGLDAATVQSLIDDGVVR